MNIESFRDFCLSLLQVEESFPFDETTLVFKVGGKIFALADINDFNSINVKCEPELASSLREEYPAVQPGYHMNKQHWNTIVLDGSVSDQMVYNWLRHSYDLVVTGLPKKLRVELGLI
jgi:predicted DNA-binding protein (MmcQ/YjbR family)